MLLALLTTLLYAHPGNADTDLAQYANCTVERETHKADRGLTHQTIGTWNEHGDLVLRESIDPYSGDVLESTRHIYDQQGRRQRTEKDLGGDGSVDVVTRYAWQGPSLVGLQTRRAGVVVHERSYTYDDVGRMVSETRNGKTARTIAYHQDGGWTQTTMGGDGRAPSERRRLTAPTDRIEENYDARGLVQERLRHRLDGSVSAVRYSYRDGERHQKIRRATTTTWFYDDDGNELRKESRRRDGSLSAVSHFDVDDDGRRITHYSDVDADGEADLWFVTHYDCDDER